MAEKQDTIETITINGVEYVKKGSLNQIAEKTDGLQPVLIRSYASGVHYGYLKSEQFTQSGKVVTLLNSRRIWCWYGAASLSQLAMEGVKDSSQSKISMIVNSIEIVNVIETIPLTQKALSNLDGVKVWKN